MPPATIANSAVTMRTEGDAWMVAQSSLSNMSEGGAPQACGNPYVGSSPLSGQIGPVSGGIAQSIGQHAGVDFGDSEEQEALLNQLENMENGPLMRRMLNGSKFGDKGWIPVLRRVVSTAGVKGFGQASSPNLAVAQHLGSRGGPGQDVRMRSDVHTLLWECSK